MKKMKQKMILHWKLIYHHKWRIISVIHQVSCSTIMKCNDILVMASRFFTT